MMVYNILLTGVGGEGILFTSVIVARAATIEGYEVRGTQLHGLAQRGGAIPAHIRIGKDVYSPLIPRGQTDLLFALEPLEAARFCYFASKERTTFLVDTYPVKPVYATLLDQPYPSYEKLRQMIEPFAKKIYFVDASNICEEKLGDPVYGNVFLLGVAFANNLLPLKRSSIEQALKMSLKDPEKDLMAFKMGIEHKL
jgi:indolepyruvate ferredoxin oxidoreductase beta subunit